MHWFWVLLHAFRKDNAQLVSLSVQVAIGSSRWCKLTEQAKIEPKQSESAMKMTKERIRRHPYFKGTNVISWEAYPRDLDLKPPYIKGINIEE